MAGRPWTKAYGRHYPGRQMADDWLDLLSQRNLWPTFTTKGVEITGQASLDGGQAELGMYTVAHWEVTRATIRATIQQGCQGQATGIPMKRKHTVDLPTKKSRHGGSTMPSVDAVLQMPMCATGPGH